MKRLMIAIAALSMAISANAGAYYWGLQSFDYTGPDGSGYDSDMGANLWANGTAFLYLGTVAYDNGFDTAGATYLANAGFDDTNFGYGYIDATDVSSLPTSSDVDATGGQAYSIVLVDAAGVTSLDDGAIENYIIVTGTSSGEYDPGTETSFASFLNTSTVIGGDGVAWAPASAEPIPEPTSGLLLLLGMAGLALKRKRA